ncbi:MAG TPA: hypothetical protein VIK50_13635 [Gemmatimonadaceae bacterium]
MSIDDALRQIHVPTALTDENLELVRRRMSRQEIPQPHLPPSLNRWQQVARELQVRGIQLLGAQARPQINRRFLCPYHG